MTVPDVLILFFTPKQFRFNFADMPRTARVVIPGLPHHVIQRGNRRQSTFFNVGVYTLYRTLLATGCEIAGVDVVAYCLMPNHVHLILVPSTVDGLRRAVARTHSKYAAFINRRQGWRGHLWQDRFHSIPLNIKGTVTDFGDSPMLAGFSGQSVTVPGVCTEYCRASLDNIPKFSS